MLVRVISYRLNRRLELPSAIWAQGGIVTGRYETLHKQSLSEPEAFWAEAASAVEWTRPWDTVLSTDDDGRWQWFAGGEANTCWNALDRHVRDGRGEQVALIYDSPLTGALRK